MYIIEKNNKKYIFSSFIFLDIYYYKFYYNQYYLLLFNYYFLLLFATIYLNF